MSSEFTNADRAQKAFWAINGYGAPNEAVPEAAFANLEQIDQFASDLLGDLRHLATYLGDETYFGTWLERGANHYQEEVEEEQQAQVPDHRDIHAALLAAGLDVETWNTGGGCMVTHAIIARNGSVVVGERDPQGKRQASEYIGVTYEDTWVLYWYDHDLGLDEGVELTLPMLSDDKEKHDIEGVADYVRHIVQMQQLGTVKNYFRQQGKVEA